MFPASMLTKLFVHGSLKNTDTGFEMRIKNIIESGTLVGMGPMTVDDTTYEPSQVSVHMGGTDLTADQISRTRPLPVRAYAEVRIAVNGAPLTPGEHKIAIQFMVSEAGKIQFNVTEPLAE